MEASIVCKTAAYDAATETFSGFFVCTNSLGCMTEDPNTVANAASLVNWSVGTLEAN
jgi:hypothetical protein